MVERLLRRAPTRTPRWLNGETVLMTCARTGDARAVKALLAHGADVNAKEQAHHQTALMWAAAQRHPAVVATADRGARQRARALPHLSADRRRRADAARGPRGAELHGAARRQPRRCCSPPGSAMPNPRRCCWRPARTPTTRSRTASARWCSPRTAARDTWPPLLLEHGADPDASGAGYTALHAAILRSDLALVKALLARHANPERADHQRHADAARHDRLQSARDADRIDAVPARGQVPRGGDHAGYSSPPAQTRA